MLPVQSSNRDNMWASTDIIMMYLLVSLKRYLFPKKLLFTLANIYLFKENNINTWKKCEICLKLRIITPERHHWRCCGVFIVNFKHISFLFLLFLLLTLNKFLFLFKYLFKGNNINTWKKMWNKLKVNKKDTGTTPNIPVWGIYC